MINNLRDYLAYDPISGDITWIRDQGKIKAGAKAASKHNAGYKALRLNGKAYLAHRAAWFLHYGYWPKQIDHINGDRSDNRLENLRETTQGENCKNLKLSVRNKTGISGVTLDKTKGGYRVTLGRHFARYSNDFFEACCLRKSAERAYKYHDNHGKRT